MNLQRRLMRFVFAHITFFTGGFLKRFPLINFSIPDYRSFTLLDLIHFEKFYYHEFGYLDLSPSQRDDLLLPFYGES